MSNLTQLKPDDYSFKFKKALILSKISLLFMIVQSSIGLFIPDTYIKDGAWGEAVWKGNDLVNLFIFSPLLLLAIILIRQKTKKKILFWLGVQALITYNYIYYALAVIYNQYFLLYLSILGISLYAFLFGINEVNFSDYEHLKISKISKRFSSILMLLFSLTLSVLWIGLYVNYLINSTVKMTGQGMISTFDILLIIVPVFISVYRFINNKSSGFIFLSIQSILCGFYCFVLMAYTPFAIKAKQSDAWTLFPLWVILCLFCLTSFYLLFKNSTFEFSDSKSRNP